MLKGIYKAASGMIPRLKQQEITANNIANVSTAGYKKDQVFIKELDAARSAQVSRRSDWEQPMIDQIYIDFTQGDFERTGNPLDVAINGSGFFVLEGTEGEQTLYTRNGNFSVDQEGFLVSSEGNRVLGDGGPIDVGSGTVSISESGEVLVDDAAVGKLRVAEFADKAVLDKMDNTSFAAQEGAEPENATGFTLRQGFLERANTDVVREMVRMITTMRAYETAAKAIQSQDESLSALFNLVGRTKV